MTKGFISLRGVEVHNLKGIDLDIPHRQLVVFCGLSGSGKTSLAIDTLYAEGQRRYIETFSTYTRQFLQRLERPAAEQITGIPPAIAVTHKSSSRSHRSTVGTSTETTDYLRLLFAKIGRVICQTCGNEVRRESPNSVADILAKLAPGIQFMVAFEAFLPDSSALKAIGFVRVINGNRQINLAEQLTNVDTRRPLFVIVDRLTTDSSILRIRESLESAFGHGNGQVTVFINSPESLQINGYRRGEPYSLDDRSWLHLTFSEHMRCDECGRLYPLPEPRLYSFNSPLGACPECEGFGNIIDIDFDLIVPDSRKSLREGAIAPWNAPAYTHELEELIALAGEYEIPLDVPFKNLTERHLQLIQEGVPERRFGGLRGFFRWLEKRKYKMHIRVFLNRWRTYRICPVCNGTRLRLEALATRIAGRNISELCALKIRDVLRFLGNLELQQWESTVARSIAEQVQARLGFLECVGLGYLTLGRALRTLSGGEAQRVSLTTALGSSLVNLQYVLDEPSIGLHPADVNRLVEAVLSLRDRGNSVYVVEHEESLIRAADQVIEIGPGAGERGGQVVFQGTPQEMEHCAQSLTGDYLAGRRGRSIPSQRRRTDHGWIRLTGARGNNLKNITVEFPLGVLCLVSGVSGSGKSTLVEDTLYPALRRRMHLESVRPAAYDDVYGDGQVNEVILVDQSPIGRSVRSNPVTYIKAFDEIRNVFADTVEARTRNYTASHFSFNIDGGRCSACHGDGFVEIDMQFLADVFMKCSQCNGTRYRPEILKIKYRGRNIAEVLDLTVREAFTFFRGCSKVQAKLKLLIDVGLDYLRLGQPANTLSGGEAQRLKLAGYMSGAKRNRTLFILDEPTTGLHFADVVQLLDCFDALLAVGHSLIVVEHNMQMMKAADWIIDLGPGAADEGGNIVAQGTPELVSRCKQSATRQFLAAALLQSTEEVTT
ncbi:MAG TPA: excinuclease ABC subunit UvrA [Pirellulales bacterium]|nr:excinuclease ABC subunit UvrA [Pirellulales bacterium]